MLSLFPSLARNHCHVTAAFYFRGRVEIYIRQIGPIFGAHDGFSLSDAVISNPPTNHQKRVLSCFFHSFMAKSFHCISGKSWKSRPDSSDSKTPMTPVTFSSSPGVSQHMWPICVCNWRPEPAYEFQRTWRDIFHDNVLLYILYIYVYGLDMHTHLSVAFTD